MLRQLLASTFLIPAIAFSQNEEVPEIPAIVQPAPEVVQPPVPVPAPQQPKALGDTLIQEPIEELKLSGSSLADLYRQYTGRRVIVSSAASVAEFQFIQHASPQDPLTYSEAAELLKKTATIENFIFVPASDDPNLDYLTLSTAGTNPKAIGIEVYTEKDILPEGDAVIMYIMSLNFLKPDEAVRVFQQVVGQFGAFGSITTSGSSVVITENTSLIRRLIELKEEIDKPSSQVGTKFITVKYADVTELATTLNELLGTQNTSNTAGVQRTQQNNNNNQGTAGIPTDVAGGSSGEETPIQIIPDARTNRLFAMGRPVDLLFVEGLVREFDTESDQRNFLRRKLKFLAVADFLPIAGDALTRAFTGTGNSDATQQGGGNRQQTNNNNNNNNRNNNNTQNAGGTGGGVSLSDPNVNSAPESLLIGRTLLVADNITNSIVVQGPPSGVEIVENLLDQIDVKADQVMISTVFGQLSLGNTTSTGVDWLRTYRGVGDGGIAGSIIGSNTNGPVNTLDPTGLLNPITALTPTAGEFANQSGLSLYGKIGSSLAAYVNLLSADSDFTILSRPSIFTANNQKGTISSGRRIAIPTSTTTNSVGGPTTSIEYRDVVLKLEVIPLVNSENEITLQIALISDDIIGNTDIENVGLVPIIGTRELLTTVTVPNNQTVVLGGLITTTDTENITGIPLLSDIPGLGRLFSTHTDGVNRDELMIFIQPSIVSGSGSLNEVQDDMDTRYQVSDQARTFADGSVLPPRDTFPVAESNNRNASSQDASAEGSSTTKRKLGPIHRR
ncbi:MAG: secretin N-terminal domain-containing protein [Luteolibacter sp.]